MKRILIVLTCSLFLFSCHNKPIHGKFTITGYIKGMPDQKVYLDELYVNPKDPDVLDTADVKDGHFVLSGIAPNEGEYRLRFDSAFIYFINDSADINFTASWAQGGLQAPSFNTKANMILHDF